MLLKTSGKECYTGHSCGYLLLKVGMWQKENSCGKVRITITVRDVGMMHESGSNHPLVFNQHKTRGSVDVALLRAHHIHLETQQKKAFPIWVHAGAVSVRKLLHYLGIQ